MNYGLPYMGSKNYIAPWVVEHLPKAAHLYDLFAGGCSVTHKAMLTHRFQFFHVNDITPMPHLFVDAIRGKYHDEKRWIDRETFMANKSTDMYIRACWSFGNNGDGYIYSKEREPWKKALHYARVFGDCSLFEAFGIHTDGTREDIRKHHAEYKEQYIRWYMKNIQLQSLLQLQSLQSLQSLQRLERLQSLESLERLQSLQSLQSLESLSVSVGDYQAVEIEPDSVIYCDPPYKGTAGYNKSIDVCAFDHERFYDWCRRQTVPTIISEYDMPPDFVCIDEIIKRVHLSATSSGKAKERLFCPKHQEHLFKTEKQLTLF